MRLTVTTGPRSAKLNFTRKSSRRHTIVGVCLPAVFAGLPCRVRDVSSVHPAILMKGNDVRRAANSLAASNYIQRKEHLDLDKADRHVIINKLFALFACVPNFDDE